MYCLKIKPKNDEHSSELEALLEKFDPILFIEGVGSGLVEYVDRINKSIRIYPTKGSKITGISIQQSGKNKAPLCTSSPNRVIFELDKYSFSIYYEFNKPIDINDWFGDRDDDLSNYPTL